MTNVNTNSDEIRKKIASSFSLSGILGEYVHFRFDGLQLFRFWTSESSSVWKVSSMIFIGCEFWIIMSKFKTWHLIWYVREFLQYFFCIVDHRSKRKSADHCAQCTLKFRFSLPKLSPTKYGQGKIPSRLPKILNCGHVVCSACLEIGNKYWIKHNQDYTW